VLVDGIGQRAAARVVADPRFVQAVQSGNRTLAGTLFHSAAAQEARAIPASALPPGWVIDAELVIQAGAGGSRVDILLRGPAGQIIEYDWKTTGRSALSYGSRREMTRHAGQITTNIGGGPRRRISNRSELVGKDCWRDGASSSTAGSSRRRCSTASIRR